MSRHNHLNANAEALAPENTNPDWTGPHPDWSLHAIRLTIEAGFRDIVDAIERAARRGDEQGDGRTRAREIHRELISTRATIAEAAGLVASSIGEPASDHDGDAAKAHLSEALTMLVGIVPGLELPGDDTTAGDAPEEG